MKNFLKKNLHWFYRLIIIIFLIVLPFYGERLFFYRKAQPLQELTNLYNSPDDLPPASALFIGNDEDQALLEETIKKIFPEGYEKFSPEAQAIGVLRYAASLRHENNAGSASKIIKDGYAICGGKDYVFRVLMRKMGVPARYIGLHYTPSQGGHDMADVYFDGSWHLFDPTFGVFVYSKSSYDGSGKILSMAEVRQEPSNGYLMQVSENVWSGNFSLEAAVFGVQQVKQGFLANLSDDFNSYWRAEITEAFTVAYGEDSWVSIPIDANLINQDNFKIGEIDKSHIDVSMHENKYEGYGTLGKSRDTPGNYNTWTIEANEKQKLKIKYWASKPGFADIEIIPLRAVKHISTKKLNNHVEIELEVLNSPGVFIAIVPNGAFVIDAIEVEKIK